MSQQQFSYKEIINSQLPQDLYKIDQDIESQAIGTSLDKVQSDVDKLELEVNPLTVKTKGLERWEKFFELPSNSDEDINIRRARIISELIQFMSAGNVITKDEMESIVGLYADECEIEEHFESYIFHVLLKITGESERNIDIQEVYKIISKVKPSWLDYNVGIEFCLKENNIYIASSMLTGEEITVYPWSVREISTKGQINLGSSTRDIEEITVYPKRKE